MFIDCFSDDTSYPEEEWGDLWRVEVLVASVLAGDFSHEENKFQDLDGLTRDEMRQYILSTILHIRDELAVDSSGLSSEFIENFIVREIDSIFGFVQTAKDFPRPNGEVLMKCIKASEAFGKSLIRKQIP